MDLVPLELKVFTIGAWKDYDELEESLTLEELTETYKFLSEEQERQMKFQASVAGAEIKDSSPREGKEESNLKRRVRERAQQEMEGKARKGERTEFSRGLGYKLIGGG